MKAKTTIDELKSILEEQREALALALAECAFINAATLALINAHPKGKEVLALNEFHFEKIRDRMAASLRQKKLQSFLKSFLAGTSESESPDVFGKN
jgi:hypothetical protein